ncbi:MAG: hypothetical protein ABI877_20175 [Gemmatimonadaceae bacterium]
MKGLVRFAVPVGLSVALTLSVAPTAQAQADSVRRVRSDVRIGVQKDRSTSARRVRDSVTVVSGGDVVLLNANKAKIDSMALEASAERRRVDSLVSALEGRNAALGTSIAAMQDSLARARGEIVVINTHTMALGDSVRFLNGRFSRFKNGSLFNNSGFYIGLGSGANFTTGTLKNSGYDRGLNVMIPIGWQKHGNAIGIRTEWGAQTFDGQTSLNGQFSNVDPMVYSGVGMLSLHLPLNEAKTNTFFLMGGGGAYMFRSYGATSALASRLGGSNTTGGTTTTSTKTKLGVTGGAGLELHILGATSFFVESRLTNVMVDKNTTSGISGSNSLRWVPVTLGFTLR